MFGSVGMTELIVLAGIALVFLGPEKFPEFAKLAARTIRDIRGYVNEAKEELAKEIKPIKKELDTLSRYDPEAYIEKLADSAMGESKNEDGNGHDEDNEEDDTGYNTEPHPDDEVMLTPDEEDGGIDGTFHYGSYTEPAAIEDEPASESDNTETTETESKSETKNDSELPERLDG